jgi:hypothetical protein
MSDRNRTAQRAAKSPTPNLGVTVHKRKGKNVAPQQETDSAPVKDAEQPADPTPDVQLAHQAPKKTIEKNREERNGVKRPSAGGLCRAVWDFLDTQHTADRIPTVAQAKLEAEARGWNTTNASIEYYAWRKFNGIRGRIAKVEAQQVAPEASEAK